MLKFLHIENIAVIERSDIEFSAGFNVLTGETGAGKSIVIDSINAVLGERTSKDLIRAGCDSAEVSALFGELSEKTLEALKEYDIEPDSDGNILITRKLSLNGKGYIKINGKPNTATASKEIASNLINIHGQHDNQALLDPQKHCDFIDLVAENSSELEKYYSEFKNLNRIRRELQALETDEDDKQHKIDLLKYQINELETADIKPGELKELKEKLAIAENYESMLKALNIASSLLEGVDDTDGAITLLEGTLKQLSTLNDNSFERDYQKLSELVSDVRDISANIHSFIDNEDYSDINSDSINNRLDYLHKLMLKYGNSEEDMLEFLSKARNELESIVFSDKKLDELSAELDASKEKLVSLGDKLTKTRIKAAKSFSESVCSILEYLNMPSVKFDASITQGRYTKRGCDEIEFMISANQGETMKPLHKIASGGELSRIMLSIKSSLLDKDSVDTMIFDEIDTGISGYAADKVGTQLKKVSLNRQVICVTHLAQIAARADNHLLIEKNTKNGRTFTKVEPLDKNERINEIARIMSGTEITENLYNSAKELLDRSLKV